MLFRALQKTRRPGLPLSVRLCPEVRKIYSMDVACRRPARCNMSNEGNVTWAALLETEFDVG